MSESLILTLLAGFFGLFMGVALLYVVDIFMQNMLQSGEQIFFAPPQISFATAGFGIDSLDRYRFVGGMPACMESFTDKSNSAVREE